VSPRTGRSSRCALYDITLKCPRNTNADVHDAPLRNLPIATDGTFSDVERFRYRQTTTIRYDTERFSGRIGSAGASGTFSVVSRLANAEPAERSLRAAPAQSHWTAAP